MNGDGRAERRAELISRPHDVYWFFDAEGRVLYIGATSNLLQRIENHRHRKTWWAEVQRIETESFPDWATAHKREDEAITAERPIHNRRIPSPPLVLPPIIRRNEPLRAVESGAS